MSGDFKYGAVVFWKNFEFDDGGKSDKLLIVLGARVGKPMLAVLTTSQQHRYGKNPGCHASEGYFFIPAGGAAKFPKDTWVQLYRPLEIDAAKLLKVAFAKDANVISNLPQDVANGIRNCPALGSKYTCPLRPPYPQTTFLICAWNLNGFSSYSSFATRLWINTKCCA